MNIVPAILAGGSGTRLWPLSRNLFPKQFISLGSPNSLLQTTALRAAQLENVLDLLIITGENQRFLVDEQLRAINIQNAGVLIEPEGRNTAPAAICAALHAQSLHGPQTLVFLMAADHVIPNQAAFQKAVSQAAACALSGRVVVFGVPPTRPETGYGYIKAGADLAEGGQEIAFFREKPTLDVAKNYLAEGNYFWNAGMFLFRADVLISEFERLEPEMLKAARESFQNAKADLSFLRLEPTSFNRCRNDSIDYALMEKTSTGAVVGLNADWDDVGTWTYLDTQAKDAEGNASTGAGNVILESARNNLIHANSRMVAMCGVDNLIVVETKDAVLVTTRERAQDVKRVVEKLKSEKRDEALHHPKVARPWGTYESIAADQRYQVKHIVVYPGQKLSLQMHHHRAEHWIVVRGTAKVTCDDKEFLLTENQSTYIPLGSTHRLENPGKVPLELIEVQSGSYLGEDDIVRFNDVYGRAK